VEHKKGKKNSLQTPSDAIFNPAKCKELGYPRLYCHLHLGITTGNVAACNVNDRVVNRDNLPDNLPDEASPADTAQPL